MTVNYVAKWNGTAWSALGSGMNNSVYALAWDGTNLYAGGQFTTVGGVAAKYITKWNGTAWSPLGSGLNDVDSGALAIAGGGTNLYVGGSFSIAGGKVSNCIGSWCLLPDAPTAVSATSSRCDDVQVTWTNSAGATWYDVLRGTTCFDIVTTFTGVSSPYYDTSSVPGVSYQYWVVAVSTCGASLNSTCSMGIRLAPPLAPSDIIATPGCTGNSIAWSSSVGATSYEVLRGTFCGTEVAKFESATSPYDDTTAVEGIAYQYWVVAKNDCGSSTSSSCVEATRPLPPNPEITGAATGCASPGVVLSTQSFVSYQWVKDGSDVPGATNSSFTATSSGDYSVRVTDSWACTNSSMNYWVNIFANPTPVLSGQASGCADPGVALTTGTFSLYQWRKDGAEISGATLQSHTATVSGSYSVRVTDSNGCTGTSDGWAVTIISNPAPSVTGATSGCVSPGVNLSTGTFSAYQWQKDRADIAGATFQTYTAYTDGSYQVRVTNSAGCTGTSASKAVTITTFVPATYGDNINTCPSTTVTLSTDAYSVFQWMYNGVPISGATSQTYEASVSGNYSVRSTDGTGCEGTSVDHVVFIDYCPFVSEVSPKQGIFKARLVKSAESSTGFFLYFQRLDSVNGYNIYEGTIGTYYSHASAPGNLCSATFLDLGSGEMRAEITPSAGNHYYLVTAFGEGSEGPSGFRSNGVEIDPGQSTCSP